MNNFRIGTKFQRAGKVLMQWSKWFQRQSDKNDYHGCWWALLDITNASQFRCQVLHDPCWLVLYGAPVIGTLPSEAESQRKWAVKCSTSQLLEGKILSLLLCRIYMGHPMQLKMQIEQLCSIWKSARSSMIRLIYQPTALQNRPRWDSFIKDEIRENDLS